MKEKLSTKVRHTPESESSFQKQYVPDTHVTLAELRKKMAEMAQRSKGK